MNELVSHVENLKDATSKALVTVEVSFDAGLNTTLDCL
jgi:hypothetical protein